MADKNFEVFDPRIYAIIAVLFVILMLATLIMNDIVILTFYKVRPILCSAASIQILSLPLTDFILVVTAMPFGIAANASRSWCFQSLGVYLVRFHLFRGGPVLYSTSCCYCRRETQEDFKTTIDTH